MSPAMNVAAKRPPRLQGLSLVELMVAITISIILLGGAISLFINNRVTYQTNENLSRLQENARFALDFMSRDLRMTGHFGCHNDLSKVENNITPAPPAGDLADVQNAVEGFDETIATWSPSGAPLPPNVLLDAGGDPAADGVTVRYLAGAAAVLLGGGVSGNQLNVDDAAQFVQDLDGDGDNDIVYGGTSNCGGSDLFEVTAVDTGAGTVDHAGLSRAYDSSGNANDPSNPRVAPYVAVRYYIGAGANGPSLFRELLVADAGGVVTDQQELVEGVERMHLLFGVDTDADGVVDAYQTAGSAALDSNDEWSQVMSVRIALLARTVDEYGRDVDTNTYQLNDVNFDPVDDRRKRRVFTTTVVLRNRQI